LYSFGSVGLERQLSSGFETSSHDKVHLTAVTMTTHKHYPSKRPY
jgi:hypothetical protein